jgi:hypothetical protein
VRTGEIRSSEPLVQNQVSGAIKLPAPSPRSRLIPSYAKLIALTDHGASKLAAEHIVPPVTGRSCAGRLGGPFAPNADRSRPGSGSAPAQQPLAGIRKPTFVS